MKNFLIGVKRHIKRRMQYKVRFDNILFYNYWSKSYHTWFNESIIIGIGKSHWSPTEFTLRFVLFGFEMAIWLKKVYKNDKK